MSHESALQPYHHYSRADVLEGRMSSQEKTLAALLERALRIKEEVAAGLQSTQGSVQVEALSRRLLENHILTVTHIVKQLSMDIQALESQIAQRDSVTSGTSVAVQSLDQKNMAGIGDLRGRVARYAQQASGQITCDASIGKLSADVSSGEKQVIRLQQDVMELRSALDVRLKELQLELYEVVGKLEVTMTKHSQGQRGSVSDLHSQVKILEARTSGGLKEAKDEADMLRMWTEQQLHSSLQTYTQGSQQLRSLLQDRMVEAESRLADRLRALEVRVESSEAQQDVADRSRADRLKHSETKLSKRVNSLENSLSQELQLVKQEYRTGFQSVRDAIESLRQIGDIKSRLDKEKLQTDIRHIRKKVVELRDL